MKSALSAIRGRWPGERAAGRASFTALLTKRCGEENNDADSSHTDRLLSAVSGHTAVIVTWKY